MRAASALWASRHPLRTEQGSVFFPRSRPQRGSALRPSARLSQGVPPSPPGLLPPPLPRPPSAAASHLPLSVPLRPGRPSERASERAAGFPPLPLLLSYLRNANTRTRARLDRPLTRRSCCRWVPAGCATRGLHTTPRALPVDLRTAPCSPTNSRASKLPRGLSTTVWKGPISTVERGEESAYRNLRRCLCRA